MRPWYFTAPMQVLDFDLSSTVGEKTTLYSDDCATEEKRGLKLA